MKIKIGGPPMEEQLTDELILELIQIVEILQKELDTLYVTLITEKQNLKNDE